MSDRSPGLSTEDFSENRNKTTSFTLDYIISKSPLVCTYLLLVLSSPLFASAWIWSAVVSRSGCGRSILFLVGIEAGTIELERPP